MSREPEPKAGFPVNASVTFDHFTEFITNRKQIIRERLQRLLNPELTPTL